MNIIDFPSYFVTKEDIIGHGLELSNVNGFISPMTVTRLPEPNVGDFEYKGKSLQFIHQIF